MTTQLDQNTPKHTKSTEKNTTNFTAQKSRCIYLIEHNVVNSTYMIQYKYGLSNTNIYNQTLGNVIKQQHILNTQISAPTQHWAK